MPEDRPPAQLVVIGSSAGGIEALTTIADALPADFSAPIVIAQHIDPRRTSHLGEILARHSRLAVHSVSDPETLEPGVIYVVPADRHVEIADRQVRLLTSVDGESRPSVDHLLSSAAAAYGEGLVAVILTGTGSDGTAGARDVAAAGGTVIIQNPETAAYPSMPQSLAPTTVDIVADLDQIGTLLTDLVRGVRARIQPDDEATLQGLLERLREHNGVDFTAYKTPTIMRRLQRRLVATKTGSLAEYMRLLDRRPEEYQRLINSFLIKVTEFFRDKELFDLLRDRILPELVREARTRENELRFWSAGCATGEEAYSLAILLAEVLGDELARFTVRIFATDLDNAAISFARRGIYPATALRDLPEDLRHRYFVESEGDYAGEYEVKRQIRGLLVFGQHDLAQRAPFPRVDLTLCRNVLIYFTPELQRRALQLFAFSLRNGGYLVLGKAETTAPLPEFFVLEQARQKVYRRTGDRVPIPPSRFRTSAPQTAARQPSVARFPSGLDLALLRERGEAQRVRTSSEQAESLLSQLPVGVVVVDRRYDIQLINNTARRLFGIHSQGTGEDFLHLVETMPVQPLRSAIDAALRGEAPSGVPDTVLAERTVEGPRHIQIVCYPHVTAGREADTEGRGPIADTALILATDVTGMAQNWRERERAETRDRETTALLTDQVKRLTEANRQLLAANEELTSANANLRGSNDEFLLATEEAQAATEEIETLNEELQATNEELETLNEELQATVEELNTTNDDLQARGAELQEMASASEAERRRLAAILSSMSDAVLVVDRNGQTILSNAAAEQMFQAEAEFVPEDDNGQPLPPGTWPLRRAMRGETFSMQFTLTDAAGRRRWFEANGQPASDQGDTQGIVVIRDISERSLRRLQEQFVAMASHELRTPLAPLQGYLQMLVRLLTNRAEDDQARQYASLALAQIPDLTSRIDDLIDVTRLQTGKFRIDLEPVPLAPLIERAVALAQPLATEQTLRMEIPAEPIVVSSDAGRLQQVLLNLFTNATRYAPESEFIDVRLRREAGDAEIEVQDYGPGIPPEDLPHIFTRFYQVESGAARGGLGLGLFISREIINALGGSISVRSTLGEGTTFVIRLPLTEDSGLRTQD